MALHQTTVATSQPVPSELDAGADIVLKVRVSCSEGCDLREMPVVVTAADGVLGESLIASHEGAINETEDLSLKAPDTVGEHTWTIVFPRHESDSAVHEESCLVVSFTTRSHPTSMAVWDVPSPVVVNRSFTVKVGVRCSAMCQLAGRLVEICDESAVQIGEGRLGDTAWPGTSALYVAEVELTAPTTEGIHSWSIRFPAAESGLAHEAASATFSFRTVTPPEHRVTVKVTDKETQAPIEDVDVRLGIYRALTDSQGLASLELPGGLYDLNAWKVGYDAVPTTVEVSHDLTLQVEAACSPEKDPDDERVWM
jgi:hypothetical protein